MTRKPNNESKQNRAPSQECRLQQRLVGRLIARTNHVAEARERELKREADEDRRCGREPTTEGMMWALDVMLAAYKPPHNAGTQLRGGQS
jgi:hypothetical protein